MRTTLSIFSIISGCLFTSALCVSARSLAQSSPGGSEGGPSESELSFHFGSLLPNQIGGVSEIMPLAGARYAFPLNYGAIEAGFSSANAHGVSYKLVSASFRGELSPMPDMIALFYAGPDFHYYTPANAPEARSEWGFHVGSAVEMHLGGPFWLRSDMRFNLNPGTALYLGFGLALRGQAEGGR